ncbi:MAG: 5-(carboxyamino)imidazole ribonucleotide synthase [Alphaproteobacteria bacterium]|nr:5-(carboxyamino)imidazole ribonucleotide synthase [Alphaproteobacteria bacterium]
MKVKSQTLGILGGGQLGRMSALAAARLGIKTIILCPEKGCPASLISTGFIEADYLDKEALKQLADQCDIITYEFENIPLKTIEFLQDFVPVYPDHKLLEASQNRLKEKKFLNDIGIETAPWAPCHKADDIKATLEEWQTRECIIKTARFGYDGKGQIFYKDNSDYLESWNSLRTDEAIIEGVIDFDYEISVIVARDEKKTVKTYPIGINEHKNHILWKTTAPAHIPDEIQNEAARLAHLVAEKIELIGVLTLELFITKDGRVLANEIAPRTHNSGHWTIEATHASQFENHVRAVCGLPLGSTDAFAKATMINLIGDDVNDIPGYLEQDNAHIHLYGKEEARDGRKMGHVTIVEKF